MGRKKALLIVEGERLEPEFFEQIARCFNLDFTFYSLKTNIYILYQKLEELDFQCDIKDVLKEMHPEQKVILQEKFAYTYLIFDSELHHTSKMQGREGRESIEEIAKNNIDKLEKMVSHFTDETDPSIGKLYINYPMMESFKDCNDFFDDDYKNTYINLKDIKSYKTIVGAKKLANYRIDQYTSDDFCLLAKMNIYKANWILNSKWEELEYEKYRNHMDNNDVFRCEEEIVIRNREIAVLNTALFLILDYYGNKDGFYESAIRIER